MGKRAGILAIASGSFVGADDLRARLREVRRATQQDTSEVHVIIFD